MNSDSKQMIAGHCSTHPKCKEFRQFKLIHKLRFADALWVGQKKIHTYIHGIHGIHGIHYIHSYMHAYVHTYIHACMHTYIHTNTHTHIHAFMRAYVHTNIYMYF